MHFRQQFYSFAVLVGPCVCMEFIVSALPVPVFNSVSSPKQLENSVLRLHVLFLAPSFRFSCSSCTWERSSIAPFKPSPWLIALTMSTGVTRFCARDSMFLSENRVTTAIWRSAGPLPSIVSLWINVPICIPYFLKINGSQYEARGCDNWLGYRSLAQFP